MKKESWHENYQFLSLGLISIHGELQQVHDPPGRVTADMHVTIGFGLGSRWRNSSLVHLVNHILPIY